MQKTTPNNESLVSIIIPSYNRETIIKFTLDSIINQTYSNWECLIIDDGSTDNTIKIVEGYKKADARFKVIFRTQLPKGAPTCRNQGIKCAKGEYVIFLDSDDILFPQTLESRIRFLKQNPDLDFCVSDGLRGEYPLNPDLQYFLISSYRSKEVLKEFFNFTIPWNTLNPTYRRDSLILKNLIWDPNLIGFQDIDFHLQTIIKGLSFDYTCGKPDCLWTTHKNGTIGKNINKKNIHHTQKLYLFNKYKDKIYNKSLLKPLALNLLRNYYNLNISSNLKTHTLQSIKDSKIPAINISINLLKLYKLSIKRRIPMAPRFIKGLIMITGSEHMIKPNTNIHFLINEFDINNFY